MGVETALAASTLAASAGTAAAGTGLTAGSLALASGGGLFASSLFTGATLAGTLGTIGTGLSLFSGLSSAFGGYQGYRESGTQAAYARFDAENRGKEIARTTALEADAEQQEVDATLRRQKLAYLASGVTLQGSPLLIMEETRKKGAANVDEIMRGGSASAAATIQEGRTTAKNTLSAGRRDFISGLASGADTLSRLRK